MYVFFILEFFRNGFTPDSGKLEVYRSSAGRGIRLDGMF